MKWIAMAYKTKQSKNYIHETLRSLSVIGINSKKSTPTQQTFSYRRQIIEKFSFWYDSFHENKLIWSLHWILRIFNIEIDELKQPFETTWKPIVWDAIFIQIGIDNLLSNSVCSSQYFIMSLPSVSQNNAHVAVISICARHCKPFFSDWLNKFHFGIKLHFLLLSIFVLMLVEKQVKECGWQEWWEIFIYILFKFIDSHNKKEEHCVLRKVRNTIEKGNIIIVLGSFGWRELRKSSVINDNKNVKSSSISTRFYFSNMP